MRNGNRGQVLVVFAAGIFFLVGISALAIDVGYIFSVRGDLQRSADAGALAGAYVFHDGDWDKDDIPKKLRDKADQRARQIASRDPVAGKPLDPTPVAKGGEIDVFFEKGVVNQIRLTTERKVDLFFAGIFGIPKVTLTATAKAAAEPVDRGVVCLLPFAIPYDDNLEKGKKKDFTVASAPPVIGKNTDKIIFPLRFGSDVSPFELFIRILNPCRDDESGRYKVGDPVEVMPTSFFPTNLLALLGMHQLAFDFANGDIDAEWEKWEKDLPGSSKFREDTWMLSPRVMRVILYDKEVAKNTGTIIVKGFAAFWIGWEEKDRSKIFTEILTKPNEVEVEGRYLSANAVGDSSTPPAWPPNLKIPSLKITRLVQ